MPTMKILILCAKSPYPKIDGGAIAMSQMISGLANANCELTILAVSTNKHPVNEEEVNNLPNNIRFNSVHLNTDIKLWALLKNLFFSKEPYIACRFYAKGFSDELTKILSSQKFDIIQIEGVYLSDYVGIIRSQCNTPISYRAHNIEFEIWQRVIMNTPNFFKKTYLRNLTRRLKKYETRHLKTYDAIVPITERDGESILNLGINKPIFVCPTGYNVVENRKTVEKSHNLFFIGALDWIPNQEGLLWFLDKVLPLIREEFPNVPFKVAGRNASVDFKRMIEKKGATFLGEVKSAGRFMMEHDIMIVPLLSGSGMRIKIIEGMAHGKSIVTTTIGAEGIPVTHENHIMLADTPENFSNGVKKLLEDQEFFIKIGHQAQNLIRDKFNNDKIVQGLKKFYQHLTT